MAEVVLQLVLERLLAMATAEAQLLGSIRGQIQKLATDLEAMKAFLCDAKARCYHHGSGEARQLFNVWVKQVREVSYEIEDAIEEFMVRIAPSPHCYSHLLQLKAKHRLAIRLQDIRSSVSDISQRRSALSLFTPGGAPCCSSCLQGASTLLSDPRAASMWIDEADTVGIDLPREKLINWLLEGESRLTATFVVGMGGLGKTTLVKKVFDSLLITRSFSQHAWVTVSKSFNEGELLRSTLQAFLDAAKEPVPPNKLQLMSNLELVKTLQSHLLSKRFILVLDDVWSADAWEMIKYALPDSECGSRILITTRNMDVATHFEILVHVHQLLPLQDKEAWSLFCKKAFRGDDLKGVCPKELESMSLSILKKCGGLPLAIVAMGGMLSRKNKTMLDWKIVCDSLEAELRTDKNLEGLSTILLLSYDDLPYYLKTCYLYLSVFPEDYLIKRMKLVRLWVVERFVEAKPGLTLEDVAEGYLNELVSRSMIQVVEMDHSNRVKTCRVHDIMREVIQLKSKEEELVQVLDDNKQLSHGAKARRISIHDNFEGLVKTNKRHPHLWSVLLFTTLSAHSSLNKKFFQGFKLLRVVELERAPIYEFPDHLLDLIHLRYLSLRKTMISKLPESIGKLRNLEIMDLKGTLVSSLPVGVLQLKQLRQIRNYRFSFGSSMYPDWYGMRVPDGIECLSKLEKLGCVEVYDNSSIIKEMGMLTELRRLGLIGLRGDTGSDVCASLKRLRNLRAFYLSSQSPDLAVDLSSLVSPPQFLQRLFLKFSLPFLPNWISSLNYLTKLVLQYSNLKEDPLAALQNLPSLVVLVLRDAYKGTEMCCQGNGYPKLKDLQLNHLPNIESVKLLDGSMPELKEMGLVSCETLKMVPQGIESLKKLEYLTVWDMPGKFCERLKIDEGEDFWRIQHIPNVTHIYMSRGGWVAGTTIDDAVNAS